jgi:Lipase (class 3)
MLLLLFRFAGNDQFALNLGGMKVVIPFVISLLLLCPSQVQAQLKPGFDADEYIGTLQRASGQVDAQYRGNVPADRQFKRVFRSEVTGLHNKWDLWINSSKTVIVIDIRGTTSDPDSWLENFYSAMIPAVGHLKLNDSTTIKYKFAEDPKAMVHVGWSIGTCSIARGVKDKIIDYYAMGVRQIIVEGHSQGGAIAFLLSSYLHYEIIDGTLPKDLVIKTYCSGAPKPGNLYFAYDFNFINRGGWTFSVVNSADWVPETPFSVQTVNDINLNPYVQLKDGLKKQSWLVRYYVNHIYNQLKKPTNKASKNYRKYLGRMAYKQVKKYMPQLGKPEYTHGSNYASAGVPIVLVPDADYYKKFPDTDNNIFRNHLFEPYYYLVNKYYK